MIPYFILNETFFLEENTFHSIMILRHRGRQVILSKKAIYTDCPFDNVQAFVHLVNKRRFFSSFFSQLKIVKRRGKNDIFSYLNHAGVTL